MIMKIDRIKLKAIYVLAMGTALTIVLIPFGAWGHDIKVEATVVSFFFFTWWQVKKNGEFFREGTVVALVLLPGCLFYGLIHSLDWRNTLISLPGSLAIVFG